MMSDLSNNDLMTAEDLRYVQAQLDAAQDSDEMPDDGLMRRILATYHALAASHDGATDSCALRWRDYAIHLAHCRECGTSNLHCARGQAFRDAAFDTDPLQHPDPKAGRTGFSLSMPAQGFSATGGQREIEGSPRDATPGNAT